ncbi:phosphopyruvate hydratase [Candidatus Parcubacteria bacterium]|nr:phosphopyruvate hydratase [Candidatus Parcubacteria bacterium]
MRMLNKIKKIQAREILDSRGNPTVKVEVVLDDKIRAVAAVPSGASTGEFEALELRDEDVNRYNGKGVLIACQNINLKINKALKGEIATNQKKIDKIMLDLDGTENKSNLGANAILGVSLACARAGAKTKNKPLYKYIASTYGFRVKDFSSPVPMFNIINGGKHADSGLSIQEFMILPIGIKGSAERIRVGSEIFHTLKTILSSKGYSTGVGDEGGFAPKLDSHTQAFELIIKAIEKSGYKAGKDIAFAIDAAANSFCDPDSDEYVLKPENISLDYNRLIALYLEWIEKYPLFSIEDGLNEEDWDEWREMSQKLKVHKVKSQELMTVADDLTVTNTKRLEKAIDNKCANAIIIKPNQIGTLSETVECVKMAQKAKWKIIVSHRSGETCDDFIADLAVAVGADFLKSGSLSRSERLAKYNRLMEIEEENF